MTSTGQHPKVTTPGFIDNQVDQSARMVHAVRVHAPNLPLPGGEPGPPCRPTRSPGLPTAAPVPPISAQPPTRSAPCAPCPPFAPRIPARYAHIGRSCTPRGHRNLRRCGRMAHGPDDRPLPSTAYHTAGYAGVANRCQGPSAPAVGGLGAGDSLGVGQEFQGCAGVAV